MFNSHNIIGKNYFVCLNTIFNDNLSASLRSCQWTDSTNYQDYTQHVKIHKIPPITTHGGQATAVQIKRAPNIAPLQNVLQLSEDVILISQHVDLLWLLSDVLVEWRGHSISYIISTMSRDELRILIRISNYGYFEIYDVTKGGKKNESEWKIDLNTENFVLSRIYYII